MNVIRLDNKRTARTAEGVEAPVISVTKSYASLNPAAVAALGLTPGTSFVGFGHDSESGNYLIWKATDSKTGKKLSANSTLVSESIYGHLKASSHYVVGTPTVEGEVAYFPLQEGTTTPDSTDETTSPEDAASAEALAATGLDKKDLPENW